MNNEKLQEYVKEEKLITVEKAITNGFLLIIPFIIVAIGVYYFRYGWYDLSKQPWTDYFIVMGIFIIGFIIHELIHVILYIIFSERKKESLSYGYDPNYLKPYCNCTDSITVGKYRIVKVLPLIITGIIPYIIGIVSGSFHIVIASSCLIGMCGVDIVVLLLTIKEKNESLIKSSDDASMYGGIIYRKR